MSRPTHCRRSRERGAILAAFGLTIMMFMAFAGVAVDTGFIAFHKTWLQNTADASALAAVLELPDADPRPVGVHFAELNAEGDQTVMEEDVEPGRWDWNASTFVAGSVPPNAVRVTAHRTAARGNEIHTIVMGILGNPTVDMTAVAIAALDDEGARARFLVDDEMIDTDIEVIEELAEQLGKTPEAIISDNNGDRYIDLPPGTELELPTGQVGDEALFELQSDFPFSQTSTPYDLEDFLRHQDGSGPIPDSMLDPLIGVRRVSNAGAYPGFVAPEVVLVSPIYKSDVSALSATTVNAKGERRGLLAFSIIGIGADPDGSGSRLPNIIIRVRAPGEVVLTDVTVFPRTRGRLVT